MMPGDGDWQDRLEAVFRKYKTRQGHNDPRVITGQPRAPDVHVHIHIHPFDQPKEPRSAVVRPLARRAMASDAEPTSSSTSQR